MSDSQIFEFGAGQHTKEYPKDKVHPEEQRETYHEGSKPHMHDDLDSKDQRSIKNKLEAEEKHAKMHGNEPSKGAKIDKKIEDEEKELIAKMDEAKAGKKHDPHNKHHHHDHHIRKMD
ncbi:hypothetical protein LTR47_009921 [Exophiala xenobiotica]|nr:hypothetical protein LTR47_009921 [Exophiala xenobiotica]KAK5250335.1 hypothetical protein LTS06_004913 [Exophiala xenobiotica]KAK5284243.1 hypothetical protein LTR40_000521 [Exophiala xenobiotica]KAK5345794.1 hypothetical protein LTR61_010495 [Exophiala xenobiotica]KAK5359176.1 hypothetical protein LTR11_010604 [Exophiala xenobiotica]